MRALRFLIPLAVFVAIGVFGYLGLQRDPREIPSPLIGRAAPDFALPLLAQPERTWSPQAMRGQVWLLNVWGSWCPGCKVEHPLLNELARRKLVPIVGIAWKDAPENAAGWLAKFGDPYAVTVLDLAGRVAIDWGVYGAPETFLIDKAGIVRFKHVGPLTTDVIEGRLLPAVREWQAR